MRPEVARDDKGEPGAPNLSGVEAHHRGRLEATRFRRSGRLAATPRVSETSEARIDDCDGRAHAANYDTHRKIARWTLPLWQHVSVTGVIVYLMLYSDVTPGPRQPILVDLPSGNSIQ